MNKHSSDGNEPSSPDWAGAFSGGYWMFVRDGRWHIHDADDGTLLGILPLFNPRSLSSDSEQEADE